MTSFNLIFFMFIFDDLKMYYVEERAYIVLQCISFMYNKQNINKSKLFLPWNSKTLKVLKIFFSWSFFNVL